MINEGKKIHNAEQKIIEPSKTLTVEQRAATLQLHMLRRAHFFIFLQAGLILLILSFLASLRMRRNGLKVFT